MTTTQTTYRPAPSNAVDELLDYVRRGGRLVVPSATRTLVIDRKCLVRFEKASAWLLRAEGGGYRLRTGKSSVYLYPGLLHVEETA